jgi:hypothetical protein
MQSTAFLRLRRQHKINYAREIVMEKDTKQMALFKDLFQFFDLETTQSCRDAWVQA